MGPPTHASRAASYLDGDDAALERLSDRFAMEFTGYEQKRLGCYSIERRWPDAPFWRRRQPGGG